jgi:aminoglycoside phosphotransferase (APT) family kinase protein
MLSPGDSKVVARDPEIPALGVVLDRDAFLDWLTGQIPDARIRSATSEYVRYKPGTSCLVAYRVEHAHGSSVITAKAFRSMAFDKLEKAERLRDQTSEIGPAAMLSQELALAAVVFPYDLKLRALRRLLGPSQSRVLDHLLPVIRQRLIHVLSYKPERRLVARVEGGGQTIIVRAYAKSGYSGVAGRLLRVEPSAVRLARTLACHPRYPVLATEWLEGETGQIAFTNADCAALIGQTLARLHAEEVVAPWTRSADDERRALREVARGLADLVPKQGPRLGHLSNALGERQASAAHSPVLTHGDFAARQVVLTVDGAAMTDLDEAAAGHPAWDVGSFLADIEYRRLRGELDAAAAERCAAAFLAGYADVRPLPSGIAAYHAGHLLRLAALPFRTREADWPDRVEQMIDCCESLPWRQVTTRSVKRSGSGVVDPEIPWLGAALDPSCVNMLISDLPWGGPGVSVQSASIRRHKSARRCLIEYEVTGARHHTVLGKTRAKGLDTRTAELVQALRAEGFGEDTPDGIAVPEFLGILPPLRMWLQAAVPGEPAVDGLRRGDAELTRRLVEAILKLQDRAPLSARTHTIADELETLEARLAGLAGRRPQWSERLRQLFEGCEALAATLVSAPLAPAHRDFYPDQVLVDGSRLVLLDFDLYALAHPALDAGNCIAHILELGLREDTDTQTLNDVAGIMHETMASALPSDVGPALDVFTTLALARLLEIDDRLEYRRACVEPLMDLSEERLSRAKALSPSRSRVLFTTSEA